MLRSCTRGDQTDGFLAKLDLKLVTGFQVQHGGVSLADQQIAVALHFGDVAQLATAFANRSTTAAQIHALGFKQSFVEGCEIQAITTIFLVRDVSASSHQIGFGNISKLFDLGKQIGTGQHFKCVSMDT